MGEGNGHRCSGRGSLQRCLDQRGPDDRCGGWGGRSSLNTVRTVGHLSVMLHNLLDYLVLLVIEDS